MVALAVADWLDTEAVRHLTFHQSRADCRAVKNGECGCEYKDCYEHGKWHSCTCGEPGISPALAVARAYLNRGDTP